MHSKIFFGKYFLVFGCILENALKNPILSCFSHFLAFSQLPNNISSTPTKSKFIKTQILNTQQKKKKFIKSEINLKSENNKTRTTHATTTTRKSEIKESKWIDTRSTQRRINPEQADRWRMGLTISGFAIWGMDSTARYFSLSRSLCVCVFESFLLSLSLSLWALLDEWARSWVFWVRRSSWMWIDLAFAGAGVLVRSLFLVVSLSLFYFPGAEVIWSENKNGNYFPPSQPYFTVKLKTFLVWLNFQ